VALRFMQVAHPTPKVECQRRALIPETRGSCYVAQGSRHRVYQAKLMGFMEGLFSRLESLMTALDALPRV
jgi:hypothetical protein